MIESILLAIGWHMSRPQSSRDNQSARWFVLGAFVLAFTVFIAGFGIWFACESYPVWGSQKTTQEFDREAREQIDLLKNALSAAEVNTTDVAQNRKVSRAAVELHSALARYEQAETSSRSDFDKRVAFHRAIKNAREGLRLLQPENAPS